MTDLAPGRPPALEGRGLRKTYGPITAVDRLSLAVAENEFFALLGPSGCGKTTLLRMIAGFERPDEGRIRLDGKDITDMRPNRRPVNMMFQSYALFPHMTVAANVAYGLEMDGVKGAELNQRVGISPLAVYQPVGQLVARPCGFIVALNDSPAELVGQVQVFRMCGHGEADDGRELVLVWSGVEKIVQVRGPLR